MRSRQRTGRVVVVVPTAALRELDDPALLRWLSRANVRRRAAAELDLDRVLEVLGLAPPSGGYAALRLWGQVGERPGVWVAAADPAFLEARLDDVHLHALGEADVARDELARLYDDLQDTLFAGGSSSLARVGSLGYLRGEPMATAALPPASLDGRQIDEYLPAGDAAASYLGLTGEIQMSLHQHPVNAERVAGRSLPVNTLWIWGGGYAPAPREGKLPPLLSGDPLMIGYWLACGGSVLPESDGLAAAARDTRTGLVATLDEAVDAATLRKRLAELQALMQAGGLEALTLVRRDGLVADLLPRHRFRFWRRRGAAIAGEGA